MAVGVGAPEEFKKGKYSLGMVVYAFAIGIFVGGVLIGIQYNFAEVAGVRADMEREVKALHLEIENVNKRIDRKIDNHNEKKNAHR